MTKQERLDTLQGELIKQLEYRSLVSKTASTIDYSTEDFERESMLKRKIMETKEWIKSDVIPK